LQRCAARRAREYLKRAAKLADEAQYARDAEDRRHLLDLAETYRRAADQAAAEPPAADLSLEKSFSRFGSR
jgi:hypothetical protein